ncbi:head-tail joining protein [Tropicimonas aquimaris]|uniref:Head-tail adaptor protein n=1 Tax=Tropicimonas aquimaris TaxID=914152 RepID=A0ABW3IXD2_9RHOB
MSAFAVALDRIFGHADMATEAVWISAATSEERTVRAILKAPDRITGFGEARVLSDTMTVDVRVGELPAPHTGDLIILGAESFVVQGEPIRDRERLIWTLDLRPA